jgi:hypothetical protein
MSRWWRSRQVRSVLAGALVLAMVLLALRFTVFHDAGEAGYALTSRQGGITLVTLDSSEGMISTEYAIATDQARKAERGVIVRYDQSRIMTLDYTQRTYEMLAMATVLTQKQAEDALLRPAHVPELEEANGSYPPLLAASITRLSLTTTIQGIAAQAYLFSNGGQLQRLWYATGLPQAPRALGAQLAALQLNRVLACAGTQTDDAACEVAGRILLRSEMQQGGAWKAVLDTTQVQRVTVPPSAYVPSVGFSHTQSATPTHASSSSVDAPGFASNASALPLEVPATVRLGPGPLSEHPQLWAFFWGKTFAAPAHKYAVEQIYRSLAILFDKRYSGALAQYQIDASGGGLKNLYITDGDPPADVGCSDFGAVMTFVIAMSHTTDAPSFWWSVGGHDPIYAIFVPASVVDTTCGWGGYHFWAPTFANGLVPFPASLFVHDAMPFLIIKVPDDSASGSALEAAPEAQINRPGCAATAFASASCKSLLALDLTTERTSHEFVETVTDPYPFASWADFGKVPVWREGEIADICQSNSTPWYPHTVVASIALDTYWSNADNACVPESRPQITILEPLDGATVAWSAGGAHVVVRAWAQDPVDDVLTNLQWRVDGALVADGTASFTATKLALGSHTITASIQDSRSLAASAHVTITVTAKPPTATISSSLNGASYGAGQTITLRGDGTDPQDHSLPDTSLVWAVNNSVVGMGRLVTTAIQTVGNATVTLTATNSAGQTNTASITLHITAPTGNPSITITSPANNSNFLTGYNTPIPFEAKAYDGVGTLLSGASVRWTDDRDGLLGISLTDLTGKSSIQHTLSGGPCAATDHHITATVTDGQGRTASDTITVSIGGIC